MAGDLTSVDASDDDWFQRHSDLVRRNEFGALSLEALLASATARIAGDLSEKLKVELTAELVDAGEYAWSIATDLSKIVFIGTAPPPEAIEPIKESALKCLILAEIALKSGERESAWYYLAEAERRSGTAYGLDWGWGTLSKRKARASKGGSERSKNAKYPEVRQECIRLIQQASKPIGKWTQESMAADLASLLQEYLDSRSIKLGGTDLQGTILKWLRTDPDIKAAFQARKRA